MPDTSEHAALVARYAALPTAIVCDVYDEHGWPPPALHADLRPRTAVRTPFAGFAATITGRQQRFDGPDRAKLAFADTLSADSVAVWAGTDAGQYCLFGDLIAATMQRRGCRGAVVDGGVRDVAAVDATGFPIHATCVSPLQGLGRWRVTETDVPVAIEAAFGAPLMVHPGDLVLADADGVVVVARDRCDEVLERAEAILAAEAEARQRSGEGMTAQEMLDRYGHV